MHETATLHLPHPTRLGRVVKFLREMFPPAATVPLGVARFGFTYLGLQAIAGRAPLTVSWRAVLGAVSLVLFMLLQRLYDELKDVDNDLRLGRAGDPKYRVRPIVTGHITVGDLVAMRWWVTSLLVALNLPLGLPLPWLGFAGTFAFLWLSFRWFFWPAVSRSLLLAFVTHSPISVAYAAYAAGFYVVDHGSLSLSWSLAPLLLGVWMPFASWELSRKIRTEADETDYQTYSKVLGWRTAALLPAATMLICAASVAELGREAGLGPIYPAIVGLATAVAVGACIRFRISPTTANARLDPYTQLLMLIVVLGFPVALCLRHGLSL